MIGIVTFCRYAGATLMPLLAGYIWSYSGMRFAFLTLSITGFIGLLLQFYSLS